MTIISAFARWVASMRSSIATAGGALRYAALNSRLAQVEYLLSQQTWIKLCCVDSLSRRKTSLGREFSIMTSALRKLSSILLISNEPRPHPIAPTSCLPQPTTDSILARGESFLWCRHFPELGHHTMGLSGGSSTEEPPYQGRNQATPWSMQGQEKGCTELGPVYCISGLPGSCFLPQRLGAQEPGPLPGIAAREPGFVGTELHINLVNTLGFVPQNTGTVHCWSLLKPARPMSA